MTTNVLVVFYSTFGHVFRLAQAVAEGAERTESTEVRLRRIPELAEARKAFSGMPAYREAQAAQANIPEATHDDLRWADGIAWGTPTRYGNMSAQMKQFLDTTGPLWQKGELEDKPAGVFTSTASVQGGHETTILSTIAPLLHLGMVVLGRRTGRTRRSSRPRKSSAAPRTARGPSRAWTDRWSRRRPISRLHATWATGSADSRWP